MRKTSIFLLALFVFIPTSYGLFSSLTVKQIDQIDLNTGTYLNINSTSAMKVPVGTVGEQPAGVNGMIRYSTTDGAFEGYASGVWAPIAGGSPTTTLGDMIVYGTFGDERLPVGAAGTVMTSVGGEPQWDISPSTISVKGDLQGHDASDPVTISVGANNTHLVADSAEASGVRWSDTISGSLNNMTDSISFTPTGTWLTNVTYSGSYKQDGEDAIITYKIVVGAGALTVAVLNFDLPPGLVVDTSKVNILNNISYRPGSGHLRDNSTGRRHIIRPTYNDALLTIQPVAEDNTTVNTDIAGTVSNALPFTMAVDDEIEITVSVPIIGWTSGTTAIVTNQVLAKVKAASNAATVLTLTDNIDFIETEDNLGAWDGTGFTAPNDADYSVEGLIRSTSVSATVVAYIDGLIAPESATIGSTYSAAAIFHSFKSTIKLAKDEVLTFRMSTGTTLVVDVQGHHISINELPATINNLTKLGPSTGLQLGDCKWSLLSTVDFENLHGTGWVQMEGQSIAGSDIDNTYSISALPNQVANSGFIRQQGSGSAALRTYQVDATAKNGLTATSANDSHNHLLTRNVDEAANLLSGSESIAYRGNVGDARYVLMGSASTANTGASSSDTHNHTITVGAGDSETRPNNVALNMYCKIND